MNDATQEEKNFSNIKELTKPQRRVLGVLLEKAFTTPDQYPLTLKAVTTGCNQKSNRDPITHYSESQVFETLEALREIGIAAVIHSEGGRSERYRTTCGIVSIHGTTARHTDRTLVARPSNNGRTSRQSQPHGAD